MTHTGLLSLLIVITCIFTFVYPRRLDTPVSRKAVHVPAVLPVLYLLYEITMPAHYNIRVDIFMLWPLIGMALVVYAVRIVRMRRLKNDTGPGP